MDTNEDQQMAALVAADRPVGTPPDLVALRAGGRRLVRRRRFAAGAAAAAVALAVGVPLAVVGGDDGRAVEVPPASQSTSAAPSPSPSPTTSEAPLEREQEVRVPLPGGQSTTGVLETGTILGATVEMTPYEGYERFAYAAGSGESACLSVGLRVDGQVVRLLCAVQVPLDERFVMWNGYRDGEGDGYELLGVFAGDTSVSIGPAGGAARSVTTRRTDVLPGYTVVLDQAPWDESWDPLQAAPLTVTTGSGETFTLRRNSYVS